MADKELAPLKFELTVIKPDGTKRSYLVGGSDDVVKFVEGCEKAYKKNPAFEPDSVFAPEMYAKNGGRQEA